MDWNDQDDYSNLFVSTTSGNIISNFLAGDSQSTVQESLFGDDNKVAKELTSGTRVAFVFNLESILYYKVPPLDGEKGTIVRMRSSHGNITPDNEHVLVRWADGRVQMTHHSHVKKIGKVKTPDYNPELVGKVSRMRVSNLGILGEEFFARTSNELIHKATKDLWSFSQGDDGYVIERLFDDSDGPLKV